MCKKVIFSNTEIEIRQVKQWLSSRLNDLRWLYSCQPGRPSERFPWPLEGAWFYVSRGCFHKPNRRRRLLWCAYRDAGWCWVRTPRRSCGPGRGRWYPLECRLSQWAHECLGGDAGYLKFKITISLYEQNDTSMISSNTLTIENAAHNTRSEFDWQGFSSFLHGIANSYTSYIRKKAKNEWRTKIS